MLCSTWSDVGCPHNKFYVRETPNNSESAISFYAMIKEGRASVDSLNYQSLRKPFRPCEVKGFR
jgi:hypothetical protein